MSTSADYAHPVPVDWQRRVLDVLAMCALFACGVVW